MSLVPYDGSDISDSEEEENETTNLPVKLENKTKIIQNNTYNNNDNTDNNLFNLPIPKKIEILTEEENDEFLQKRPENNVQERKPVKITIPSLSKFDDNDTSSDIPIKRYRPASAKGTGLFSVLPPPKVGSTATTSLIPQSVSKPKPVQQPLVPRIIKKQVEEKLKQKIDLISSKSDIKVTTAHDEDDDDNNDDCTDFFSLDKPEPDDLPVLSPEEEEEEDKRIQLPAKPEPISTIPQSSIFNDNIHTVENNPVLDNHLGLDEAALKALIGSKGKRKLETVAAQIVDLHENDIKPDNREWYENALLHGTGPEENSAVNAVPGGILKRKHQITYLAQQAKANEQQLKNMWAQNRATRQQTQSKYGF